MSQRQQQTGKREKEILSPRYSDGVRFTPGIAHTLRLGRARLEEVAIGAFRPSLKYVARPH